MWLPNVAKPFGEFPQALPWAEAVARERQAREFDDAPASRCLPNGLSFAGTWAPYRLIQTPELLAIIDENADPPRQIYLDGRPHPMDLNPTYMGHSIGRWEGTRWSSTLWGSTIDRGSRSPDGLRPRGCA